jgi:hypothetical protein
MKHLLAALAVFLPLALSSAEQIPEVRWTKTEMNVPWIKRGKLLYFDPGQMVIPFGGFVIYYPDKRENEILRLAPDSFDRMLLVEREFPDGVDKSFVEKYLNDLLTAFGVTERFVDSSVKNQLIIEQRRIDDDPKIISRIDRLFSQPSAQVNGNRWRTCFVTINPGWRVRLRFAEGTLKPFVIEKERLRTLIGQPVTELSRALLEDANTIKSNELKGCSEEK